MRKHANTMPKTISKNKSPSKKQASVKTVQVQNERGIVVPAVGIDGKVKGKVTLPKELFAATINPRLMTTAVRVYLANQREGSASTKTRGEVAGSTRKIYRQKGTGRARHGSIRAPIFVHGGVALGPKPRDYSLSMPKKMKRQALASALTQKLASKHVIFVDGLATLQPKTKEMVKTLEALGATNRTLLVVPPEAIDVKRSARNIKGVDILPARSINTYDILRHKTIVIMKETLAALKETFVS